MPVPAVQQARQFIDVERRIVRCQQTFLFSLPLNSEAKL